MKKKAPLRGENPRSTESLLPEDELTAVLRKLVALTDEARRLGEQIRNASKADLTKRRGVHPERRREQKPPASRKKRPS